MTFQWNVWFYLHEFWYTLTLFRMGLFRAAHGKGEKSCRSDLRPATLLKKRLRHSCFPVIITKLVRRPFLWNTSGNCFCMFDQSVLILDFNDAIMNYKISYRGRFLDTNLYGKIFSGFFYHKFLLALLKTP